MHTRSHRKEQRSYTLIGVSLHKYAAPALRSTYKPPTLLKTKEEQVKVLMKVKLCFSVDS